MDIVSLKIVWILLCFTNIAKADVNLNDTLASMSSMTEKGSMKILSRTKRYLIFPDGSSFQLVFCAQNMGYLQLDVVWFGTTAALAWELPTDPNLYNFLKKDLKDFSAQKRQDVKHIVYFNEDGKVVSKVPYRRKPIVNPAFAKRSIDSNIFNLRKPVTRDEMHEKQKNKTYIHDLDVASTEFHREGRKSLYAKLEKFFEGLGLKGKPCVFRLLCEHSRRKDQQGTFLQEIMKATFTFPRSHKGLNVDYDNAHPTVGGCEKMYPECANGFLFSENVE